MFAIVVHKNIELGDHTLNNEKLSPVNTKFLIKKKMKVNLENLNLLSSLKMICLFVKVDQNVYKTPNKSALIHTNQIQLLSSNRPEAESYLQDLSRVFKKNKTTVRWNNCISQTLRFLQTTTKHQYCPVFSTFTINHKNFIPKYLNNALTDFAYLNFTNVETAIGRKSSHEQFGRLVPSVEKYSCK